MLDKKIKIAGDLTVEDWDKVRGKLKKGKSWDKGVKFFEERIENRFLKPIQLILDNDTRSGEGFTAMAIICLLIEHLQAFKLGGIYKSKEIEDKTKFGYKISRSQKLKGSGYMFTRFLKENSPFNEIPSDPRSDFFGDVRCALLHEAGTKEKWLIRKKHKWDSKKTFDNENGYYVLYRTAFFDALKNYCEKYQQQLLNGKPIKLRHNYIIKFDEICQINDQE